MIWIIYLFLIGIAGAILGSIVGLGGGIVVVPALVYGSILFLDQGMDPAVAVGTSLIVLIFTASSSTWTYYRQQRVDWKLGWIFFAASGPGAIIGSITTSALKGPLFHFSFGLFMLLMSLLLMIKGKLKPIALKHKWNRELVDLEGKHWHYGISPLPALLIGLVVGFISGLFGVGGGSLFVPLMVLLFAFPPHVATATSMFIILLSSILGGFSHVLLGNVDWQSAAVLAPGALLGGYLGASLAYRLKSSTLLWALRVILLVVAVRMLWDGRLIF
jgi:uncharacterized membrane protein YfcA